MALIKRVEEKYMKILDDTEVLIKSIEDNGNKWEHSLLKKDNQLENLRAFSKLNYSESRFPQIFHNILIHMNIFELNLGELSIFKTNVLLACSDKYATSNLKILRANQDVTPSNNKKFTVIFIENYSNDLELHKALLKWSESI